MAAQFQNGCRFSYNHEIFLIIGTFITAKIEEPTSGFLFTTAIFRFDPSSFNRLPAAIFFTKGFFTMFPNGNTSRITVNIRTGDIWSESVFKNFCQSFIKLWKTVNYPPVALDNFPNMENVDLSRYWSAIFAKYMQSGWKWESGAWIQLKVANNSQQVTTVIRGNTQSHWPRHPRSCIDWRRRMVYGAGTSVAHLLSDREDSGCVLYTLAGSTSPQCDCRVVHHRVQSSDPSWWLFTWDTLSESPWDVEFEST